MSKILSRRNFIGTSFALTSTVAMAEMNFINYLKTDIAKAKVSKIVCEAFAVSPSSKGILECFYRHLLTLGNSAREENFLAKLRSEATLDENLEIFVVEEFVVATNFFETLEDSSVDLRYTGPLA